MNRDVLVGLSAAGLAAYELFTAFTRGYVHGQYNIRIHREGRPGLFWTNVVVYAVFGGFGLVWAALHP